MKKETQKFLKVAVEAAKKAGSIQMKSYEKKLKIDFKGEINLVTEVDKECEVVIRKMIAQNFPEHDFLGEETGGQLSTKGYKWIVDPLDGTTNYAHGYPMFCVSIALENRGKMILGVVYIPYLDELFFGVSGEGAWLQKGKQKKRIKVSEQKVLKKSMLCTGFAYNVHSAKIDNLDHFRNFLKTAQAIRRDGAAAIDICYIACGRFDGFWEMGLKPWDIAAASLILDEAGGRSSLFDGSRLDIYQDNIVCSNRVIHAEMLKILKK